MRNIEPHQVAECRSKSRDDKDSSRVAGETPNSGSQPQVIRVLDKVPCFAKSDQSRFGMIALEASRDWLHAHDPVSRDIQAGCWRMLAKEIAKGGWRHYSRARSCGKRVRVRDDLRVTKVIQRQERPVISACILLRILSTQPLSPHHNLIENIPHSQT